GSNAIEMHKDAIKPKEKVIIIDDVLATGGTAKATVDLVEELGGNIVGIGFLIDLTFLKGKEKLAKYNVFSLIQY
ncbi:MAG: phosphoribosyltransferase family protein, partial [Patescibacteria group bacterium]